jgi:hypothetical protein
MCIYRNAFATKGRKAWQMHFSIETPTQRHFILGITRGSARQNLNWVLMMWCDISLQISGFWSWQCSCTPLLQQPVWHPNKIYIHIPKTYGHWFQKTQWNLIGSLSRYLVIYLRCCISLAMIVVGEWGMCLPKCRYWQGQNNFLIQAHFTDVQPCYLSKSQLLHGTLHGGTGRTDWILQESAQGWDWMLSTTRNGYLWDLRRTPDTAPATPPSNPAEPLTQWYICHLSLSVIIK